MPALPDPLTSVHRRTPARLAGLRALVVDDAPAAAKAMATLLNMEKAQVATASNGAEALARLETESFDVVLSDIGMPVMDGHELARAIRGDPRWSHLPMLALSGFTREANMNKAGNAGFDGHLSKPASLEQMVDAIQRVLGRTGPAGTGPS